jgi:hypothetical protein
MTETPEKWLTRKAAANYLTGRGCAISANTLANKAANNNAGHGPPYHVTGWRTIRYAVSDLDVWLRAVMRRVE